MVDYSKKKNDELVALLKERSLPHTGKKADFVKRLEDYDAANGSTATVPAAAKPAIEDEIDWDDEPAAAAQAATTEPAAEALEAGGVGEVKNPVDVPNQSLAEDPAKTDDLTVAAEGDPAPDGEAKPAQEEKAPEKDYSSGITEATIDAEIEKRRARARKFGMEEDDEGTKMLMRAKKFGIVEGSNALGLLNTALSQRGDKKRGLDGALDDGGLRKKGRGRGRGNNRPSMGSRQNSGKPAPDQKTRSASGVWMTQEDRDKAEKRKQRFAVAT